MPRKIEISHRTIIFTVLFLGLLWFLYFIRDIILQIFVALLIMSVLNPLVTKLQKFRVPRVISIVIVYVAVFVVLGISIAVIASPLVNQTSNFANSLPKYLEDLNIPVVIIDEVTREVTSQIGMLPSQVVKVGVSLFSNVITVFTVFIFALYFLLAQESRNKQVEMFFNKNHSQRIVKTIDLLEGKLGGWARGQFVLMLMVGVSTYVGLLILGIPFALPLALLSGILEIVPTIGPIIAAIPVIIVGLVISPLTGLAAGALAFLIQQIEFYVFVPKVMEKSTGTSPITTLLALIIGVRVAGIVGALLSVPIVLAVQVFIQEFLLEKDEGKK